MGVHVEGDHQAEKHTRWAPGALVQLREGDAREADGRPQSRSVHLQLVLGLHPLQGGYSSKGAGVMASVIQTEDKNTLGKEDLSNTQNGQKNEHTLPKEGFPTSDHQSILVSLSRRCVWKGTVCEQSHLFRIRYYGNLDKPLGRFLRDDLFDQSNPCRSCEMAPNAHVHCYTHYQGSLIISVRNLPEFLLPGEKEGKIWMWHRCLQCPRTHGLPPATRRVVMSDAAWASWIVF